MTDGEYNPGYSELETLYQKTKELYKVDDVEKPKVVVDVDEGGQIYYNQGEEIQLLNQIIKQIDDATFRVKKNIGQNLAMLRPLKPFEEQVVQQRDELAKNQRLFETQKRAALTDSAISDLHITEGVNKIMRTLGDKSKKPMTSELTDQIIETVRANEAIPLVPEEETIPVKPDQTPTPPQTPPAAAAPPSTPPAATTPTSQEQIPKIPKP